MLPESDAQSIAAKLRVWSERPIRQSNARSFGFCIASIVVCLVAAKHSQDPLLAIRSFAGTLMVVLGTLHCLTIISLRWLMRHKLEEAAAALQTYRDPRRLSSLDMALFWSAVALIAPHLG
jgi:hypothetical protein